MIVLPANPRTWLPPRGAQREQGEQDQGNDATNFIDMLDRHFLIELFSKKGQLATFELGDCDRAPSSGSAEIFSIIGKDAAAFARP